MNQYMLKITNDCFNLIKSGERKTIRHGYSKNKKYTRLFNGLSEILLRNELTGEILIRHFKSIDIILENTKKIIEISFI